MEHVLATGTERDDPDLSAISTVFDHSCSTYQSNMAIIDNLMVWLFQLTEYL